MKKASKVEVLAKGLPASPGAAVGQIVFTADEAVAKASRDRKNPVILVRGETTPEDIHGMEVAKGILTSRGGMTSHAAVVTRGMGKCCVAGAGDIEVNEKAREMRVKGQVFKDGDWISLDGTTGRVIKGKLNTLDPSSRRSRTAEVHELVRTFSHDESSRQRRHSARCDSGARVRRRGHRPLPHRAHVLRRRENSPHAGHDSRRQRKRPPRRAEEVAARCSATISSASSEPWTDSRSPSARSIRRCTNSCPAAKS